MKILQFTIPVGEEQTVIVQEDSLPYFYPHLHRHKETQITWIQKGTGTLLINDYVAQFEAGDIYIIGSNQPHLFKSDPHFFENEVADAVQTLTLFFHSASFLGYSCSCPK